MDSKSLRLIAHQSFFSAVRSDDLEALKKLVENEGSDPSFLMALQNEAKATALYIAAENNFLGVFMYLLGFCDLDVAMMRAKSDMDALQVTAYKGHLDIVKELLKKWPELCRVCNSSKTSPLYSAASQNHLQVVNAILDVDVSTARIVRKNGKTALHTTARYGQLDMVKTLIGRDPGIVAIKDKKGQTALHMAVKGQDSCVVEELLEADHSILNERDKKGNTALHIATRKSRSQIVTLLLTYRSVDINAMNAQRETALDIADRLPFGPHALEISESLSEAGGKHGASLLSSGGQPLDSAELKRTVSDIRHEVQSQVIQNEKTQRRVSGIAKELRKIHREAVQNTINSVTVVAVLVASIAFIALFNLPGLYKTNGPETGQAMIAHKTAFRVFCLLDSTALFISLSVVVVQITLVAWDTRAQKRVVSVVNKMMWAACVSTCGAFLSISFVVVGRDGSWMADTVTGLGGPILVGTLASLCYFVFRKHFGSDSQRRIRRASGSKSFSWSYSANVSDLDDDFNSDEKIYAL
ncbi:Ankyrin repeat-containing protein [Striga hermonthica]|uniref:Ankyrin repeat-containing protein n=1 Tax=Striga hermonthica TaxID=68872 RepID=A0A9N7P142_STRHE|nr:Ankyrin repeat-containing protein [Striga hermonthica]